MTDPAPSASGAPPPPPPPPGQDRPDESQLRAIGSPFVAGLAGRCPHCGRGPMFEGYLRVAERCAVCGFDLRAADSGDGPAVFIILIVGFIACFGLLITEIAYRPPVWVELLIWPMVGVGLCLALLRPAKGLMLALQFRNRASEAGGADLAASAAAPIAAPPGPVRHER